MMDYRALIKPAEEILKTLEAQNNHSAVIDIAREIGFFYGSKLNEYETAISYYKTSLNAAEKINDKLAVGKNLSDIGLSFLKLKKFIEAAPYFEQSVEVLSQTTDLQSLCIALGNLGVVCRHLENYDKAVKFSTKALALDRKLCDVFGEAEDSRNLSCAYVSKNELDLAFKHCQAAGKCYQLINKKHEYFQMLCSAGDIAMKSERYDKAVHSYEAAYAISTLVGDPETNTLLCYNLGLALVRLSNYSRANILFQEGVATSKDGSMKSKLFQAIGDIYKKLNNMEKSLFAYLDAIESLRNHVTKSQDENLNLFLKVKLIALGETDISKDLLEKVVDRLETIKNQCLDKNDYFKLSLLCLLVQISMLREYDVRLVPFLEETIALAIRLDDPFTQAQCAEILAKEKKKSGEFTEVEHFRNMAKNIYEEYGETELVVNQLIGIANSLKEKGQINEAIHEYKKVLKIAEEADYSYGYNVVLSNLANAYREAGDLQSAIIHLEKVLESCEEEKKAFPLRVLGFCHEDLGDYSKAVKFHMMSYGISSKSGKKSEILCQQGNLGRLFLRLGKLDEAFDLTLSALNLSVELGHTKEQAVHLSNIGVIYKEKNSVLSIDYFLAAIDIYKKLDCQYDIAVTCSHIGIYYTDQENYDEAIKYLKNALDIFEEIGAGDTLVSTNWFLAGAYEQKGNVTMAGQYYEKTMKEIENLRRSLIIEDQKMMYMGIQKTIIYKKIINFYCCNNNPLLAFRALEFHKSRSFIDLLSLFANIKNNISGEDRIKEKELISLIRSDYKSFANEADNSKRRLLVETIQRNSKKLDKFYEDIKKNDPIYVSLRQGETISFEEIKLLLES